MGAQSEKEVWPPCIWCINIHLTVSLQWYILFSTGLRHPSLEILFYSDQTVNFQFLKQSCAELEWGFNCFFRQTFNSLSCSKSLIYLSFWCVYCPHILSLGGSEGNTGFLYWLAGLELNLLVAQLFWSVQAAMSKPLWIWGLPWWLSGKEFTCQRGRHGFDPWSGKIPHAAEQWSPCTTTTGQVP